MVTPAFCMHITMRISLTSLFVSLHSISQSAEATTLMLYGDSILRMAALDRCGASDGYSNCITDVCDTSKVWPSLGNIPRELTAGPIMCNVENSPNVILEFMAYGFGYEVPLSKSFDITRHSSLPPNSKESLKIIKNEIAKAGITVDGFVLESNLWDIMRWTDFFSYVPFQAYTDEWKANATEMFQLVEELFPESKHMWLSTSVAPSDTQKSMSDSLNEVARSVLPDSWTYLDIESVLDHNLIFRPLDTHHLAGPSNIPLVNHLLDLVAEASVSTSAEAPEANASTSAKAPEANASSSAKAPEASASSSVAESSRLVVAAAAPAAAPPAVGGGPSWAWGLAVAALAALGAAAALGGAVVAFRRWGTAVAPARADMFRPLDGDLNA
jgi:hypothetical protein